jgi:hypothetical protein
MILNIQSFLVQVADTWVHISTEPVTIIQKYPQNAEAYSYGCGLAPRCLNMPSSIGTRCNKNFWGCGIRCSEHEERYIPNLDPTDRVTVNSIVSGRSTERSVFNYTDNKGLQYAIEVDMDLFKENGQENTSRSVVKVQKTMQGGIAFVTVHLYYICEAC